MGANRQLSSSSARGMGGGTSSKTVMSVILCVLDSDIFGRDVNPN